MTDPITYEDTDDAGEPGTEFNLFMTEQEKIFPVLVTDVEVDGFLFVVNHDNARAAVHFEPTSWGIRMTVRGFRGDDLVASEVVDHGSVTQVNIF